MNSIIIDIVNRPVFFTVFFCSFIASKAFSLVFTCSIQLQFLSFEQESRVVFVQARRKCPSFCFISSNVEVYVSKMECTTSFSWFSFSNFDNFSGISACFLILRFDIPSLSFGHCLSNFSSQSTPLCPGLLQIWQVSIWPLYLIKNS